MRFHSHSIHNQSDLHPFKNIYAIFNDDVKPIFSPRKTLSHTLFCWCMKIIEKLIYIWKWFEMDFSHLKKFYWFWHIELMDVDIEISIFKFLTHKNASLFHIKTCGRCHLISIWYELFQGYFLGDFACVIKIMIFLLLFKTQPKVVIIILQMHKFTRSRDDILQHLYSKKVKWSLTKRLRIL